MDQDVSSEKVKNYTETKMGDEKKADISLVERLEGFFTNIFDQLNCETNFSTGFCCTLMIVSFTHLFSVLYDQDIGIASLDNMSWSLETVTSNLGVYRLLTRSGKSIWYYLTAYLCGLMLIAYLLVLFLIGKFSTPGRPMRLLARLAARFSAMLHWVLFIPMLKTFLAIIDCDNSTSTLIVDSGTTCWSSIHMLHLGIMGFFCALFVASQVIIVLYGNDCNPYNKYNPFSRFEWDAEIFHNLFRLLYCIMSELHTYQDVVELILPIYLFMYSLRLIYLHRQYLPYHNYAVALCFSVCAYSVSWVSIVAILSEIIERYLNYTVYGETILVVGGLVGVVYYALTTHSGQLISFIMTKKLGEVSTEEEFNRYISGLISLMLSQKWSSRFNTVLLEGYVASHKSECADPQCPFNNDKVYYLPVSNEASERTQIKSTNRVLLIHLVQYIYKISIARGQSGSRLVRSASREEAWNRIMLSHAYFLIYQIGNLHSAAVELFKVEQSFPSLSIRVAVAKAKTLIQLTHDRQNARKMKRGQVHVVSIDPRLLLEYEAKFIHFRTGIFKVAVIYREIWSVLLSPVPDLNVVQAKSEQAVTKHEEVVRVWAELCALHLNYHKAELAYAMYLSKVLGQEELAERHFKHSKSLVTGSVSISEQLRADNAIFEASIAVVAMSAMPDTFGTIVKASSGVAPMFEYSPNDLVGKAVTLIMPHFIADHHSSFVHKYLQSGNRKVVDAEFDSFACNKQQYIFQVRLLIREYYDQLYGSTFVALIKSSSAESVLVTDTQGTLQGMSLGFANAINVPGFSPTFIKENVIRIQYICPYIEWKQDSGEEEYERFVGSKYVIFSVPSNICTTMLASHDSHSEGLQHKDSIPFQYDADVKPQKWKCTIVNVVHHNIKLKAFYFRGTGRNIDMSVASETQDQEGLRDGAIEMKMRGLDQDKGKDDQQPEEPNAASRPEEQNPSPTEDLVPGSSSEVKKSNSDDSGSPDSANDVQTSKFFKTTLQIFFRGLVNLKRGQEPGAVPDAEAGMVATPEVADEGKDADQNNEEAKEETKVSIPAKRQGTAMPEQRASTTAVPAAEPLKKDSSPTFTFTCEEMKHDDSPPLAITIPEALPEDIKGPEQEEEVKEREKEKKEGERPAGKPKKQVPFLRAAERTAIIREIALLKGIDYKKYVPPMARRVLKSALAHFIIMMIVTAAIFILMFVTLSTLRTNYDLLVLQREINIMKIVGYIRTLVLTGSSTFGATVFDTMKRNMYNFNYKTSNDGHDFDYTGWVQSELNDAAIDLLNSQDFINRKIIDFVQEKNKEEIDPSSVTLMYTDSSRALANTTIQLNTLMTLFGNEAIKLSDSSLSTFTETDNTVVFMFTNAYQELVPNNYETSSMLDESTYIESMQSTVALGGMGMVFFCGLVTFVLMLPLWYWIINQGRTSMKLLISIAKQLLKEQISHCAEFMQFIDASENDERNSQYEDEFESEMDENASSANKGESDEGDADPWAAEPENAENEKLVKPGDLEKKKSHSGRKQRKYHAYKASLFLSMLYFICIQLFAGFIFFFLYYWPLSFEENVQSHLDEIIMLHNEPTNYRKIYMLVLEMFATNGTRSVAGTNIMDYAAAAVKDAIGDQETLIRHFNEHKGDYSSSYVNTFDQVMLSSVCISEFVTNVSECENIDNGILQKGIYAAHVQFLNRFGDIVETYISTASSDRTLSFVKSYVNSDEFIMAELTLLKYNTSIFDTIIAYLQSSFLAKLGSQKIWIIAILCVVSILIMIIYFVTWWTYIDHIREKLLRTKMTLCNIPVNVIASTEKIRQYFFDATHEVMANFSSDPVSLIG